MMCHDMRRFEKIAEEKKRREKKQEMRFDAEDQPEILENVSCKSNRLQKG